MQTLRQDIAYALRQMRLSPVFTLTTMLTLALGIGATTAIFSLIHTVMLKSLPVVDPSRFDASGGWANPPEHWIEVAEGRMEAGKLAYRIRVWIDDLPARQREVVLLRDVEGMSSEEVCAVLALSDVNQRVLLHRGRSRLRQLFEDEFRGAR